MKEDRLNDESQLPASMKFIVLVMAKIFERCIYDQAKCSSINDTIFEKVIARPRFHGKELSGVLR